MGYRIYGDDIEPLNTVAQAEALSYSKNTIVSVLETGRAYQFNPDSVATRDGIRVLTPAGGGRLVAIKGLVSTDGVHLKGDGGADDPIEHSQDTADLFRIFVGTIISGYSAECLITSDGSTVTASVQSVGGGDIRYVTTDGYVTLDCTPAATVVLSAGTDSAPVTNWIYIDITDGLLKKSTTGFPSSPYVPIDKRLIPSASFVQSYGTYPGNNFSDHVYSAGDNGHLTHLNQNFRLRPPVYISGALTTISGSGTANCTVAVASGEILMNHLRMTYAFTDGSNLLVANDQVTPYQIISNLYNLTTDTTGATLTGRWAAHFIWYGHAQESSGAKLFINKPSGTYLSADEARSDTNGYFNSSVPPAFRGCAIGLRRVVARRSATGTIEINYKTSDDWRGKQLSSVAGSGGTTSFSSIFPTSDFRLEDVIDASKEIAFSASAIATGQTRTISMPNNDVDLALASREATSSQSGLMTAVHVSALTGDSHSMYPYNGGRVGGQDFSTNGILKSTNGNRYAYFLEGGTTDTHPRATFYVGTSGSISNTGLWVRPDYSTDVPVFIEVLTKKTNDSNTKRLILQQGTTLAEIASSSNTGNSAGTDIHLYTYGNTQLYLKNDGTVGNGTTSPTAKSHIKGATSNNSSTIIKIDDSSNSEKFSIRGDGLISLSGSRVEKSTTYTSDATLTVSSTFISYVNPAGTGMVLTLQLSPITDFYQTIKNVSLYDVTLGRNGQKINNLESNYTLAAGDSVTLHFPGATLGHQIISNA